MTTNALRNVLVAATVLLLGVIVATNREFRSRLFPRPSSARLVDAAAGERVWQGKNCGGCHSMLGNGSGAAPDLTTVIYRRDPVWLASWLADPHAVNTGARMPNLGLADADVTALVALFWSVGANMTDWPPLPRSRAAADSASGAALFRQKGCAACHRIGGKGTAGLGPDLSRIGGRPYDALPNTPEFLGKWLENPQAQKSGALMPRLQLTPTERDALVRYLTSLR